MEAGSGRKRGSDAFYTTYRLYLQWPWHAKDDGTEEWDTDDGDRPKRPPTLQNMIDFPGPKIDRLIDIIRHHVHTSRRNLKSNALPHVPLRQLLRTPYLHDIHGVPLPTRPYRYSDEAASHSDESFWYSAEEDEDEDGNAVLTPRRMRWQPTEDQVVDLYMRKRAVYVANGQEVPADMPAIDDYVPVDDDQQLPIETPVLGYRRQTKIIVMVTWAMHLEAICRVSFGQAPSSLDRRRVRYILTGLPLHGRCSILMACTPPSSTGRRPRLRAPSSSASLRPWIRTLRPRRGSTP